ncbi:low molecular weight protein-tyrosine-phosphatase [Thermoflexibacter ruber]|uniref:Protein tyrosine phosphatase n=1 Tax=Thermoflexibacter ruber TaxID=1003 RepID=A0A1I2HPL7_9BACT|nr:low molecular weight protein-tyrosine-phosphatase [Thermoflexibacter ruber]SFF32074.1 protein tyrosine phosphatase [Thermoflexibacter ruber]
MVKVLFVCLGNICRSPLAEGILKKLAKDNNLEKEIIVDSAGTSNYHIGESSDKRAIKIGKKYGLEMGHKARQVRLEDFKEFDYIFAMDNENFKSLKNLEKKAQELEKTKAKIYLMREFDNLYDDEVDDSENDAAWEVADPYYGGEVEFEECYDTLERCNKEFLKYLQKTKSL